MTVVAEGVQQLAARDLDDAHGAVARPGHYKLPARTPLHGRDIMTVVAEGVQQLAAGDLDDAHSLVHRPGHDVHPARTPLRRLDI